MLRYVCFLFRPKSFLLYPECWAVSTVVSCVYVCVDLHQVPYAVPWLLGFVWHTMLRYVCFLFRPTSIMLYILNVELFLTYHIQCVKKFHFLRQNRGVFPSWGDTSSFIGPNFLLNLVQRTVFSVHGAPTRSLAIQIRREQTIKHVVTQLEKFSPLQL